MPNDIVEKLTQAVNEDAESAAVKEGLKHTTEVAGDKQTAGKVDEKGQKAPQKQSQSVPYDRFAEQNQALKQALERIDELSDRDKEQSVKLAQLETDHDVLERLRGLGGDDRYKGLVETLDKALRGIHEEVETGDKTKAEASTDTKKLFEDHRVQLEDAFAQQRADLLWNQAQSVSERMLEDLGADYDENDKEAIAKLWNPATDWDTIEENPDVMRQELLKSLKTVVESYGEPRGALKAKVKQFEENSQQVKETAAQTPNPEEALKGLLDKDWGKVKTNADGKIIGPEHSDEDFQNVLAKVMRANRQ